MDEPLKFEPIALADADKQYLALMAQLAARRPGFERDMFEAFCIPAWMLEASRPGARPPIVKAPE